MTSAFWTSSLLATGIETSKNADSLLHKVNEGKCLRPTAMYDPFVPLEKGAIFPKKICIQNKWGKNFAFCKPKRINFWFYIEFSLKKKLNMNV